MLSVNEWLSPTGATEGNSIRGAVSVPVCLLGNTRPVIQTTARIIGWTHARGLLKRIEISER